MKVAKSVISGKEWSIVNIDSRSGCELLLHSPRLARVFYDIDSNLVSYYNISTASSKHPVSISIGSLRDFAASWSERGDEELAQIALHITKVLAGRTTMVVPFLTGNVPVPFDLMVETFSQLLKQTVVFTDRFGVQVAGRLMQVVERSTFGRWIELHYEAWQHCASRDGASAEDGMTMAHGVMRLYPGTERSLLDHGVNVDPSEELRALLVARGRRCVELLKSCSYVKVTGIFQKKDHWGQWTMTTASGRALVDPMGAKLNEPDTNFYDMDASDDRVHQVAAFTSLTDEDLFRVSPYVVAFGFSSKIWGRIVVENVHPIQFRENAFDMLVLPADDKKLMLSLVRNIDPTQTTDFVDGKGGGCAMLFHGRPGLGKTLSAEAIAEVLKRPLYAVGIGELGVSPEALEDRLTMILATAQRWNAVLLLDEADIFLEERSERDITRNAMVGVFLRLMEYYNGVLILTTNRVQHIDEAFFARVSLAIKFEEFSVEQRAQVIRNLLSLNGLSVPDAAIHSYAAKDVNGRQLKNSIRIARLVAHDQQRAVSIDDVEMITERMRKFREGVRRNESQKASPKTALEAAVAARGAVMRAEARGTLTSPLPEISFFQTMVGLKIDGLYGPDTASAMARHLANHGVPLPAVPPAFFMRADA